MQYNYLCVSWKCRIHCNTDCLCLLNALVHRTHPLSSPTNLGEIIVPIYRTQGDSVKHSRQTFVQTAKYCLPQITYLLIHVFFINVRQRNVKLVLLKELKPIILHFASENYLLCECRKFKTAMKMIRMEQLIFLSFFMWNMVVLNNKYVDMFNL